MDSSEQLANGFIEFSRRKLIQEQWPRVRQCLESLTTEQVWWRPNEQSNSVGNLLLHLNGNIRQWILEPLGKIASERDRDAEFEERRNLDPKILRERLEQTLQTVDGVLSKLRAADLLTLHDIQKYKNVSGADAIHHVVEHFSMHYGQILYVTKMLTGSDLGFYGHSKKPVNQ